MRKKIDRFFDMVDEPFDIILIPFYIILGKLYLAIRYRSKAKRDEIFQTDFEGSYGLLVKLKIVQLVAFVFALMIFVALIFFTIRMIHGEM